MKRLNNNKHITICSSYPEFTSATMGNLHPFIEETKDIDNIEQRDSDFTMEHAGWQKPILTRMGCYYPVS